MTERLFDTYIAVDWSARNMPSPTKPSKDALWVGIKDTLSKRQEEIYFRTRYECRTYLQELLLQQVSQKKRVLIGYDFYFGFPAGFVDAIGLKSPDPKWLRLWKELTRRITDDEMNVNNRFAVAETFNKLCATDKNTLGPLWGHPHKASFQWLKATSSTYPFVTKNGTTLRKSRWTEMRESRAQPAWKLIGTASVGGQGLVGIPAVYKLRFDQKLKSVSKVWPFEIGFTKPSTVKGKPYILHVEIWPGILNTLLDPTILLRDQAQVKTTVDWFSMGDRSGTLATLLEKPENLSSEAFDQCVEEEGWVIGSGWSKRIVQEAMNNQQAVLI